MEFDDYETLPSSSTATHMVAGSFAGIMEHCIMYPVDSVKVSYYTLYMKYIVPKQSSVFY